MITGSSQSIDWHSPHVTKEHINALVIGCTLPSTGVDTLTVQKCLHGAGSLFPLQKSQISGAKYVWPHTDSTLIDVDFGWGNILISLVES
jgi:hypothetical protein